MSQYNIGIFSRSMYYCIVLKGWSLLPNSLVPFQIYCDPLNLGITRTWICRLNFAQSLKSQARDPQLKVPPEGLVIRILMSWKNPSTSVGFEPTNLGSRGEHVTPRPPRPTMVELLSELKQLLKCFTVSSSVWFGLCWVEKKGLYFPWSSITSKHVTMI